MSDYKKIIRIQKSKRVDEKNERKAFFNINKSLIERIPYEPVKNRVTPNYVDIDTNINMGQIKTKNRI